MDRHKKYLVYYVHAENPNLNKSVPAINIFYAKVLLKTPPEGFTAVLYRIHH